MNSHLFRAKSHGQSIPIIALIIVVLFAMVGLSVDVGNTYAENRSAVRGTNAAALAGMDKVIRGGDDSGVAAVIKASFLSNGITAQLNPNRCAWAGRAPHPGILPGFERATRSADPARLATVARCPGNVTYHPDQDRRHRRYLLRAGGRPITTLPVKAQAFAAQCSPVKGVYPIAVNAADLDDHGFIPPSTASEMSHYGQYYDPNYQGGLTQTPYLRQSNFGDPGSFSFMKWSSAASGRQRAIAGRYALGGR